ncbi:Uma2 family endonuclease [Phormidium yuhuli AB48]|uniref:Uma2 family endonuclease n=1 Tax=Phormidium yuhuli AB48 TaxID=2940671 RepID=A0ABY5AR89_9CYAN|nr:Uma2 family endonuclease [Phormidium yuhuli]USR91729.1 Uma2 family endonuclease [Phormidium yuhuli AB48]
MVRELSQSTDIIYPDGDGQPMADNTKQFRWIVVIKENLELLFADNPDVFVAGDLLWYPVEGNNRLRRAPDAMVVFGRPKGDRGSYKQWEEDNIAPQVVFEILSPGNRFSEMAQKQAFYNHYGVEEYYVYDPDEVDLTGMIRNQGMLEPVEEIQDWVSPRLGIRFQLEEGTLKILTPTGDPFLGFIELDRRRREAEERANLAEQRANLAEEERQRERQRADAAEAQLQAMEQRLRELGLDSGDS